MSTAGRLVGLPPLIGPDARVLVLGSFPSAASLAAQQYYAHKRNQFWKILGEILAQPLHAADYATKCHCALAAGIAIWDVYAACERAGSLDSAIRAGQPNDFTILKKSAPALRRVCFNGKAAARWAPMLRDFDSDIDIVELPSTSPANASWSFARKLLAWQQALSVYSGAMSTPTATNHEHRLTLSEVIDALIEAGEVPQAEAEAFRHERRYFRGTAHPLSVVAEQRWKSPPTASSPNKLLDLDRLSEWLAGWAGLPYYHIDPLKVNLAAVTDVMSSNYATRFRILPVEVRAGEVTIATAEPFIRSWEKELKPILKKDIRLVIANPEDIARYQVEFYNMAKSIKGAMKRGDVAGTGIAKFEQLVELGKTKGTLDANDQHIVLIVDWLWQYAFEQRASDIHIEPRRDMGLVRFRIDGVLHQVYQIPTPVLNAMTSRIKILGRMDVVEKRRPQDGRIKTRSPDGGEIELRLSTLPTAFGEKLVMRIFDPEVLVRDFADLGFSSEDAEKWRSMTGKPNGIILVTGPTGSGKTTTLYSTLKQLATPEVNVCTLEDPIEMVEPAFNQVQIQTDIGMGFAAGIRALMRQDPDIIMVGEIRDIETAEMAIQAALTGHLVLSTLHTNDAPTAITRLLDLGMPPYLLQSTVLGVMAQRLVRTLCPHCKTSGGLRAEDELLWQGLVAPWKSKKPEQIYHPVGCLECRMTGYMGRIGIYEIMPMVNELKSLVTAHTDLVKLRERAFKTGMQPLRISGARKVAAGLTTMEEVLKVAPPLQELSPPV